MRRCRGDLLQDVIALDEFAKRSVLVIEETRVSMTDKELAAGRVRIVGACHGKNTPIMMVIIKLGFNLVARPTRTPTAFRLGIFGERISTLNHKALNDPVKAGAIVKTFLGER